MDVLLRRPLRHRRLPVPADILFVIDLDHTGLGRKREGGYVLDGLKMAPKWLYTNKPDERWGLLACLFGIDRPDRRRLGHGPSGVQLHRGWDLRFRLQKPCVVTCASAPLPPLARVWVCARRALQLRFVGRAM